MILGALWLTIVAYNVALAVAVVLLAAVRFQPAPADVVFAVLIRSEPSRAGSGCVA